MNRLVLITTAIIVGALFSFPAAAAQAATGETSPTKSAELRLRYDSALASLYGDGVPVNVEAGLKALDALDKQDVTEATYQLAAFYGNGEFVQQDLRTARRLLNRAAAAGDENAAAQLKNVEAYLAQHPVDPNPFPTTRAADGPDASHEQDMKLIRMSDCCSWDQPPPDVFDRLQEWVKTHPKDAEANFRLALFYINNPAHLHRSDVITLLARASELGYSPAKSELGNIRVRGAFGLRADPAGGLSLLREGMERNDPVAFRVMGLLVFSGEGGMKADVNKATELCDTATRLGMPQADRDLAIILSRAGDVDRAAEASKRAAAAGDLMEMHDMAVLAERSGNNDEAFRLMRKAALVGGRADCAEGLGKYYMKGVGTPVDLWESARWFRIASRSGAAGIRASLATTYLVGQGAVKDVPTGLHMLRDLDRRGDPWAAFRLGQVYASGELLPRNLKKAREYLRRAADGGVKPAPEALKAVDELEAGPDEREK